MDNNKRIFKFYMKTPDREYYEGEEYESTLCIEDYDYKYEDELEYILNTFKRFLGMCGWSETSLSQLQYLEDDEWKYVLEQYGTWDSYKEDIYLARRRMEHQEWEE